MAGVQSVGELVGVHRCPSWQHSGESAGALSSVWVKSGQAAAKWIKVQKLLRWTEFLTKNSNVSKRE